MITVMIARYNEKIRSPLMRAVLSNVLPLIYTHRVRFREEQLQESRYHHRSSLLPLRRPLWPLLLFCQPTR